MSTKTPSRKKADKSPEPTAAGGQQTPLNGMEDEFSVDPQIKAAADGYASVLFEASAVRTKKSASRDELIAAMRDKNVNQIRIHTSDGERILRLDASFTLKIETPPKVDNED